MRDLENKISVRSIVYCSSIFPLHAGHPHRAEAPEEGDPVARGRVDRHAGRAARAHGKDQAQEDRGEGGGVPGDAREKGMKERKRERGGQGK